MLFERVMDERRLKIVLGAFFLALAVPSVVLVVQAYKQLRWEAFRQTQVLAEDLVGRIDADLRRAVAAEEARAFGDYAFLVAEGDPAASFVQRSPLSAFPVESEIPGAIGYFQIDAGGTLTTPLLPASKVQAERYGISQDEQRARLALERRIREVLVENRLVQRSAPYAPAVLERFASPADSGARSDAAGTQAQAAFDRLLIREEDGRVASLPAANASADAPGAGSERRTEALGTRQKRTEPALVPEPAAESAEREAEADGDDAEPRVRTFQSELDPLEAGLLDTGHIVLFRNAWRDDQRYIQGVLVDRERFLARTVEAPLLASSLSGVSDVAIAYAGNVLGAARARAETRGPAARASASLLHRARLSPPFAAMELIFSVDRLPRAPGSVLLAWVTATLAAVLCGGFLLMYRFAVGQLRLTRQQQDFVSSVSHELKTPLTSIRMYGEMLKSGWADDAKKQAYYDYIHDEAERLSRLIENVLQLGRLRRSTPEFDAERVTTVELLDQVASKVASHVQRAGFHLELHNAAPDAELTVDTDCFTQIMINLVDNALKFCASAERKVVELSCRREGDAGVLFIVRDFGPGVPKAQMKRIFELFYRPPTRLTRETSGTGIGLALVQELATAMNGRVDVRNREPGAEFRLWFPAD